MDALHVKAVYCPDDKLIHLTFQCEDGQVEARLPPASYARIVEYLDMVLTSYSIAKAEGRL